MTVRIPTPLRKLTGDQEVVTASGDTVGDILQNLDKTYPGIGERIYDETGAVRRFVNVFLNDEDIRFLEGPKTKVAETDEISIVPAIAGG